MIFFLNNSIQASFHFLLFVLFCSILWLSWNFSSRFQSSFLSNPFVCRMKRGCKEKRCLRENCIAVKLPLKRTNYKVPNRGERRKSYTANYSVSNEDENTVSKLHRHDPARIKPVALVSVEELNVPITGTVNLEFSGISVCVLIWLQAEARKQDSGLWGGGGFLNRRSRHSVRAEIQPLGSWCHWPFWSGRFSLRHHWLWRPGSWYCGWIARLLDTWGKMQKCCPPFLMMCQPLLLPFSMF